MDRSDRRNPFDPQTYFIPEQTIETMIELRAFCAAFFETHVRNRTDADTEDIAAFVALITHSQATFARARAVIPELQLPDGEPFFLNSNANVQELHSATKHLRGLRWESLLEEPAWGRLVTAGTIQQTENVMSNETGHQKQLSDASAHGSSSKHMFCVLLHRIC